MVERTSEWRWQISDCGMAYRFMVGDPIVIFGVVGMDPDGDIVHRRNSDDSSGGAPEYVWTTEAIHYNGRDNRVPAAVDKAKIQAFRGILAGYRDALEERLESVEDLEAEEMSPERALFFLTETQRMET